MSTKTGQGTALVTGASQASAWCTPSGLPIAAMISCWWRGAVPNSMPWRRE